MTHKCDSVEIKQLYINHKFTQKHIKQILAVGTTEAKIRPVFSNIPKEKKTENPLINLDNHNCLVLS